MTENKPNPCYTLLSMRCPYDNSLDPRHFLPVKKQHSFRVFLLPQHQHFHGICVLNLLVLRILNILMEVVSSHNVLK